MHFALCWHRNRFRLAVYAVLAVALTVLATLPVGLKKVEGEWVFERAATPQRSEAIWSEGARNFAAAQLVLLLLMAADLGAGALADDTTRQSLHFLLTRPRRRSYFALTNWAAGVSQTAAILLVAALPAAMLLFIPSGSLRPSGLAIMAMRILTIAALVFGAAYVGAAVTGSARRGYETAAATVVVYLVVRVAANTITGAQTWFTLQRAIGQSLSAPALSMDAMVVVALLVLILPLAGTAAFARREV
jgi:hypothetical protein